MNASASEEHAHSPMPDGWYLYMLKLVETGLRPLLEDALKEHGFTAGQYTALAVLRVRPGLTSSELARRSFVRAQSMAETVGKLSERGFIRRDQNPTHARHLLLYPTDEGLRALDGVAQPVARVESQMLAGLGAEARGDLASTLRTLRYNLHGANGTMP